MIMVAPNGGRRGKDVHPAIPLTTEEIVQDAIDCAKAGAAAMHMHVRNNDNRHTINPECYQVVLDQIRGAVGHRLILQVTSESGGIYAREEQMDMVRRLRPEAVSMAIAELAPDGVDEEDARAFFQFVKDEHIAPQFICYGPDDVARLLDLRKRGIIPFARPFALFVLGRYTDDRQSDPADLAPFLDVLGAEDLPWALCAFGVRELDCVEAAVKAGGHVRVGFENNVHRPDGTLARSNGELVALAARRIRVLGDAPMGVEEARKFFNKTLA
jgi:uncharacterized protein (DUF849 family)